MPFDSVRLVQGDSDRLIAGGGTGGSKSIMASGSAVIEASDLVIAAGRKIAAHFLEAGEHDVEFAAGRFTIAGTDRSIGIMDLAGRLRAGAALPDGVPQTPRRRSRPQGVAVGVSRTAAMSRRSRVDPDTGVTEVVRYTMVNDFGTVVNPLLVEGQLHGGVVQGIGQALLEATRYDEDGQLVTGSFMDYCLPRAADAPDFRFESRGVPTKTNPVGAKGCGEAGCAGALPSVMNAVVDALSARGVRHLDMPATPLRVWSALNGDAAA